VARALDAGVDDFIMKPVNPIELCARLRAVHRRRRQTAQSRTISLAGYVLDRTTSTVTNRGIPVTLTAREFSMAWLLFSNPGTCLSRSTISLAVWGVQADISWRTLEQHIYKVRKKLELSAERGVSIRTLYSMGYHLEVSTKAGDDVDEYLPLDHPADIASAPVPIDHRLLAAAGVMAQSRWDSALLAGWPGRAEECDLGLPFDTLLIDDAAGAARGRSAESSAITRV
jgi:DNA-binding winged helix-turn-helix (wHTH) protein